MTKAAAFEEAAGAAEIPQGHPTGLYVLFGAEMWERFSYYGMRALLVLYLTKHLNLKREDALAIYGTYTGLVYVTPLLGGYLADKFLGQRKAILVGGIVMAAGHFAMAFEPLLELALGLLILGNGFFKPNISTMVGQLYRQGDARRDSAYTIFYMGINLGAFFSPLVCGTLGESERFGWHYGFGAAGVGMIVGLITFTSLQRFLGTGGYPPGRAESGDLRLTPMDRAHVTLISLACLGFVSGSLQVWPYLRPIWSPKLSGPLLLAYRSVVVIALASVVKLVTHLALRGKRAEAARLAAGPNGGKADLEAPFSAEEWQRIAVILIVAVFSIVFWMGFEQAGGTLNLFADEKTDRALPSFLTNIRPFGYQLFAKNFPASWFQSVNPLLIVLLAPLPLMVWTALDRTRFGLTSTAKMGLGLILLGVGFMVMAGAERAAEDAGKVGPQWLSFVYLLFTLGELCLSPIGLSLVNKLAPARVASLMMATWFLCTAVANYLAGTLESLLKSRDVDLWKFLIFTSIVPGVALLTVTPILKKMGHGRI